MNWPAVAARVPARWKSRFAYFAAFYVTSPSTLSLLPKVTFGELRTSIISAEDIATLLQRGYIFRIGDKEATGAVHLFTVVEKRKKRRRLISEPRTANCIFEVPQEFRFSLPSPVENIRAVASWRRRNPAGRAVCIDFSFFYGQMGMSEEAARANAFVLDETFGSLQGTYAMRTVPTGGRQVVGLAQATTESLVCGLGSPTMAYIDNVRILAAGELEAFEDTAALFNVCATCGIRINETMEEALSEDPVVHRFLGWNFKADSFNVSDGVREKLQVAANRVLRADLRWGEVEKYMGLLNHVLSVCRLDDNLYYIYKFVRRRAAAQTQPHELANIWPCIKDAFRSVLMRAATMKNVSFEGFENITATASLVTDASKSGWGAVLQMDGRVSIMAGPWTPAEATRPINELEAMGVLRALEAGRFPRRDRNGRANINVVVDNTSVMYAISKLRSRSFWLNEHINDVKEVCRRKRIRIVSISYVNTKANNADALSRIFEN